MRREPEVGNRRLIRRAVGRVLDAVLLLGQVRPLHRLLQGTVVAEPLVGEELQLQLLVVAARVLGALPRREVRQRGLCPRQVRRRGSGVGQVAVDSGHAVLRLRPPVRGHHPLVVGAAHLELAGARQVTVLHLENTIARLPTALFIHFVARFQRRGFGEISQLVGRYCTYLLPRIPRKKVESWPKQTLATFSNNNRNKTLRQSG